MDLPMSVGADGDAGGGVVCDAHRCYPHILNTPALRGLTGVGESVGRADRTETGRRARFYEVTSRPTDDTGEPSAERADESFSRHGAGH
jgi:hypothetical protein